jgi:hypothetical protein
MMYFYCTVSDGGGPHYALPLAGVPLTSTHRAPSGGIYGKPLFWKDHASIQIGVDQQKKI